MKMSKPKQLVITLLTIADVISGFYILQFGITTSVSLFSNKVVTYTCSNGQHGSQLYKHSFGNGFMAVTLVVISILLLLGLLKYKKSLMYRAICLVVFVLFYFIVGLLGFSYFFQHGFLGPCYIY